MFEVLTTRQVCELPDPEGSDELLGPLVFRGNRLIVGAHTGEGKTTFVLQLIRAIVDGEPFLDWHGIDGGVRALVVDAEQGLRTIKRRLREAGLDRSDAVDYLRVPDGLRLDSDPAEIDELELLLEAGRYAAVIFDPLYKLHGGDSNAERAAIELMRLFDMWRATFRFAAVMPVHLRKPIPTERFSIHDIFGSTAYTRGAEVVLGLRRVSNGFTELHFFKDRDGDLEVGSKWGLLFDREQGFRRAPEDEVDSDETLAERLLAYVRKHPGKSTNQVTKTVEGRKATLTRILRSDERFRSERVGSGDHWYDANTPRVFPGDGNPLEHPFGAKDDQGVPPTVRTPEGGSTSGTPASLVGSQQREPLADDAISEIGLLPLDELQARYSDEETCRRCGETFRRGTGNKGDLCRDCTRDDRRRYGSG